jgi:hypothetical protein
VMDVHLRRRLGVVVPLGIGTRLGLELGPNVAGLCY